MKIKNAIKFIFTSMKAKNEIPILQSIDKDKLLSGKVALILGGTGGIGKAIVRCFVQSGCNVIVCGTNSQKMEQIKKNLSEYTNQLSFLNFDLSQINNYDAKLTEAVQMFGKIDIVVFSAGVHSEKFDLFSMTESEYDRVLGLNLKAPFFLSQKVAEYMIDKKIRGHILFISASRGQEPAYTPYGISKWALNGMTKGLAAEMAKHDIRVNAIAPGSTATDLIGIKDGDSIYTDDNAAKRLITPQEVGNLALFLVSEQANMIMGETIHISGGRGIFDIR